MEPEKHVMKLSNVFDNMKSLQSKLTSELFNAICNGGGRQLSDVKNDWIKIHGYRTTILTSTTITTPSEGKYRIVMEDGYAYWIASLEYDLDLGELAFAFNRTRIEIILNEEINRRRFVKDEA